MLSLVLSILLLLERIALPVTQTDHPIFIPPPPPVLPVEVELISPPAGQMFVEDLWRIQLYNTLPSVFSAYIFITIELAGIGLLMEATTAIFLLPPGYLTMSSADLSPITTEFYNTGFENSVGRMGGFPDGVYTITYYVYEAGGGLIGSTGFSQDVQNHSAPELQYPIDNGEILEPLPVFSWFPSNPPPGIIYTVRIVEILLGQSPGSAIAANPAWFFAENLIADEIVYPISANGFEYGKSYAWQVEGFYENTSTGKSEIRTFHCVNPFSTAEEGSEIWSFGTGGKVRCSPAIALDGSVICGSDDGYVYSLDSRGNELWRYPAGGKIYTVAIGPSGSIYATCDSGILCLDPSGFLLWQNSTMGPVLSCPLVLPSGRLYAGSPDGGFYSLEILSGEIVDSLNTENPIYLPASADSEESIYFASGNVCISVTDNEDGFIEEWSCQISKDFSGGPVIAGEHLYAAAGRKILCLGLDGETFWSSTLPSRIHTGPVVSSEGSVYAGTGSGNIYAVESATASNSGVIPAGAAVTSTVALDVTGSLFFGCDDGYLRCFSPSGFNLWEFETGGAIHSSPVIGIDGTIYFGSDDQCIYAVAGSGAGPMTDGWPQFCKNSSNNGFIESEREDQ